MTNFFKIFPIGFFVFITLLGDLRADEFPEDGLVIISVVAEENFVGSIKLLETRLEFMRGENFESHAKEKLNAQDIRCVVVKNRKFETLFMEAKNDEQSKTFCAAQILMLQLYLEFPRKWD